VSRWFRHYAGMMRDEKLVGVALRCKQPVERVIWVWGAILESAAEINDAGRYNLDAAEVAYFLRTDESDVVSIQAGLEGAGRVRESRVVKWGDRQFQSDRSAARQKDYREREKAKRDGGSDTSKNGGDGNVTAASRHGDAPETETETETDNKKIESGAIAPDNRFGFSPPDDLGPTQSAEDEFWEIVNSQAKSGTLSRAMMIKHAKLSRDFHDSVSCIKSALRAKDPRTYLGKSISNISEQQRAPPEPEGF
jgi:hypothetical protein